MKTLKFQIFITSLITLLAFSCTKEPVIIQNPLPKGPTIQKDQQLIAEWKLDSINWRGQTSKYVSDLECNDTSIYTTITLTQDEFYLFDCTFGSSFDYTEQWRTNQDSLITWDSNFLNTVYLYTLKGNQLILETEQQGAKKLDYYSK